MEVFKVLGMKRHRMYIDGKGINTLVALAGCPLKCKYCLNKKLLAKGKAQEMTIEMLLEKVLIDYCYFKATGGGITFGGGEALLYSSQIKAFRETLPGDIPIKLETSLNVEKKHLLEVLDVVDEYIIDVKTINSKIYLDYTGLNNRLVIENLKLLCEERIQNKCKIRIPNIPGFTKKEDIDETVSLIKNMGFENLDIFEYVIREDEQYE